MLNFNIVTLEEYLFRCVLGETLYFDFTVEQLELFGYDNFFSTLKENVGNPLYSVKDNKEVGDLASVRYLKPESQIWILVRNGIRGELYVKEI